MKEMHCSVFQKATNYRSQWRWVGKEVQMTLIFYVNGGVVGQETI